MNTKCAICAVLAGLLTTSIAAAESGHHWHQDFAVAARDAETAGLPLLLHFHAEWCGPCQRMEHSVLNEPEILNQLGSLVIGAKIDVDEYPELVERFKVSSYPFDVLLASDGEVLLRTGGYAPPAEYLERIQVAAAGVMRPARFAASQPSAHSGAASGLNGYSPVSIVDRRQWIKGRPDLACEYNDIVYYFVDESELDLFRADPSRYVPQLGGCDAVALTQDNREQPGSIRYAAFYRQRLYLFASSQNRLQFIESRN